jgi:biotin-(acetyl-CoA carboxylase) ligase
MVTLAATKSYGQCPGKGGGTFTGTELAEPMTSARTIVLGSAVCGLLAKGGNDTFTLAAKKGDCLEVDFHSKSAQLHVLGAGINVNAAGDDVSQLRATANGTLSITVSAASTDEYTLMVR